MAKQPETKLKEKIRPLLDAISRSWWVKTSFFSIRGIPDFLGCVNGHFVAIELKKEHAKPDPSREVLQRWVCSRIRDAGGMAFDRVDDSNYLEVIWMISETCLPDQRKL